MEPLSIVIPAYNEEAILEESLQKVHAFLEQNGIRHEILVVSNGSTDRTEERGRALAERHAWFRFFSIPERSVGQAFALGAREARHEYLVTLDADLSSDLNYLLDAHGLLHQSGAVIGSKTLGRQRRGLLRVVGSQLYIAFSQLVFGLTLLDYSMGCKAYRRSLILPVLDRIDRWTGYTLDLCLFLQARGARLVQIGVDCDDRRRSRFNLWHEGVYRYVHLFRCWQRARRSFYAATETERIAPAAKAPRPASRRGPRRKSA